MAQCNEPETPSGAKYLLIYDPILCFPAVIEWIPASSFLSLWQLAWSQSRPLLLFRAPEQVGIQQNRYIAWFKDEKCPSIIDLVTRILVNCPDDNRIKRSHHFLALIRMRSFSIFDPTGDRAFSKMLKKDDQVIKISSVSSSLSINENSIRKTSILQKIGTLNLILIFLGNLIDLGILVFLYYVVSVLTFVIPDFLETPFWQE